MQTGDVVGRYTLGPQIGQGAFGNIFTARDSETGLIYAIKNESTSAERHTLDFEYKIFRRIQGCNYFPKLFDYGKTNSLSYVVMELVGPSLSSIIKTLPMRKLSLSTGIRTAVHALKAVHALHTLGIIHRDIKPGNILVRLQNKPPITLIDFGLARIYQDQKTGEHITSRQRAGFRGTKTYASLNAHLQNDLSRRDDMVSWFYFLLDVISDGLPWKNLPANTDVAVMKKNFNVAEFVAPFAPELARIWELIIPLRYEDEPPYAEIEAILQSILDQHHVKEDDPWDWAEYLASYREKLTEEFGVSLRIDSGADPVPYYTELGVPPAILQQIGGRNKPSTLNTPLLAQRNRRQFSQMQNSELNEKDEGCCC